MASIDGNQGGGVIDLGAIQSEEQSKDSGLFQFPRPRADSNLAVLLDIFGVMKTITLTGIIEGTVAEQNTFIAAINAISDGEQISSTFTSSQTTSPANIKVFIQNFRWTKQASDVNKLEYTLTLLEGELVV